MEEGPDTFAVANLVFGTDIEKEKGPRVDAV